MTERPMLFSGAMVSALLAGTKTQTRRIVKAEHHYIGGREDDHNDPALWGFTDIDGCWHVLDQSKAAWFGSGVPHESYAITCPYGAVGDRLWVRETWRTAVDIDGADGVQFAADGSLQVINDTARAADLWTEAHDNGRHGSNWRPSIFMRRWASRITLEVTGVRVERLLDITEEDARAEGVESRLLYAELWDQINGKRAPWVSNPFVWVVSFRLVSP